MKKFDLAVVQAEGEMLVVGEDGQMVSGVVEGRLESAEELA